MAGLALAWGGNWPAMKFGLDAGGLPPLWLAALRFVLGALCLAPFVVLLCGRGRGGFTAWMPLPAASDRPILIVGALGPMAGLTALACLALAVLPAGPSAVVAYSTSLWVVPAAWWWLRERPGAGPLIGVALGLSGIVAMSGPWALDWSDPRVLLGQAALLVAAALWAASILHVRARGGRLATPLPVLVLWQLALAAGLLLPVALLAEGPPPLASLLASPAALLALLYVGPLGTALAFMLMLEVNRRLSATGMATATLAVPPTGLLLGWALLGEKPTAAAFLGAAMVVAGVALAALVRPPVAASPGSRTQPFSQPQGCNNS
ncbi:MAG: DMT family transporter [Acetobacteraceae bacterium]